MKRNRRFTFMTISSIVILALIVAVVMGLWNWIVPGITGWGCINYWQALGLVVLFRLLSGHFWGHGYWGWGDFSMNNRRHRHFHERMRHMGHDERKAFIRDRIRNLEREEDNNEK